MLHGSKYILRAQEIGAQCLRIQRFTNGYDKNVSGMFVDL